MERQSCARCGRAGNSTIATYAGWAGGVVAALGVGAAILSGAGAAAADASSGSASSAPAHSARGTSAGTAHAARAPRSAAPANTSRRSDAKAAVAQPRNTVTQTLAAASATGAPTTAQAPVLPKVASPNPMAMVTAAVNSFFRQVQTAFAAVGIKTPAPRGGPSTWGAPTRTVTFTDSSVLSQFVVYTGTYPDGIRTPEMLSFSNGTMTITGDAQGHDEGIAWVPGGQKYGGWEVRLRVPPGAKNYDPVLLLWPDAENWPKGGEVDFMEMWDDPARQTVNSVLHYGQTNKQIRASMAVDATQWHTYAVKWTPTQIVTYVDGVPLFTSTNKSTFPPGSMHLCIQLDVMGPDIAAGAQMEVAWAKQYSQAAVS
ncbi:glycosyl hydrolase family 16 [Mycobacterium sp. BK086]|uniref:glycoside hydrolase family 16 protein n=1 Tax=Mycobacterium sp. BK086 TaxID=2512165 RepID=UPI001060AE35|nr:family 16 glycosylhydrolase [Mycobacterium sp. BK086]TDO17607.1 glycosyl hydrolase family 16 [Mycobacterium sp. BK086]